MKTKTYCGKKYRIYDLKTDYGQERVFLYVAHYRDNNSLAVEAVCTNGEPYATITVNLPAPASFLADAHRAYVDTNNCPWAPAFLEENGLASPEDIVGRSGYCEYPLYNFNLDQLTL